MSRRRTILTVSLVVTLTVLMACGRLVPGGKPPPKVGDRVRLVGAGKPEVWVAHDLVALNDLTQFDWADERAGIEQMVAQGRAYLTPADTGALVLTDGDDVYLVRLTDGPHADEKGWVPRKFMDTEPPSGSP